MKKIIIICVSLLLFILPACQSNNTEDLFLEVENLQNEIDLLKAELEEVTKERDKLKAENEGLENNGSHIDKEGVLVEVVNKINKPKDESNWVFDDRVNFHISITNNSNKDIKKIEGVLDIKSISEVSILRFDCDLTGDPIKSGETFINKDTLLKINKYVSQDLKVYNTDHDDLIYTYKINKIIFTDESDK